MQFKSTESLFGAFGKLKILVVGDVMIDRYVSGQVTRISPEAPVPVIKIEKEEVRLGGAANVAFNLKSLEVYPILCSVVGNDDFGRKFTELVSTEGLSTEGLHVSNDRKTTVKNRIMSQGHHLLRMDDEEEKELSQFDEDELLKRILNLIPQCDAVIFEDYDKGVLTTKIISEVISNCIKHGIPTAVDPKKRNFSNYRGATLFKPNFKELVEGTNEKVAISDASELQRVCESLRTSNSFQKVVVTLSGHGILFTSDNASGHLPAHLRTISDVSGAGDTVIALLSLGLAMSIPLEVMAEIANLGGGIVCESSGVVPVDRRKLMEEVEKNALIAEYFKS